MAFRLARRCSGLVRLLAAALAVVALVGCGAGSTAPVVKIGVIAPFEGVGRPLGYDMLAVVRAAAADAMREGESGPYRLLVVAQNDSGDAEVAALQVKALAADPQVAGILGPWDAAPAAAASVAAQEAGMPLIVGSVLPAQGPGSAFSMCPPADSVAEAMAAAAGQGEARAVGPAGADDALGMAARARAAAIGAQPGEGLPSVWLFSGDAEMLAEELAARQAAGRTGPVIAGPDAHRPWLPALGGPAANGVRAVACDAVAAPFLGGAEPSLAPEARAAYTAARALVRAIGQAPREQGMVSRRLVATALQRTFGQPGRLAWWQVADGKWVEVK